MPKALATTKPRRKRATPRQILLWTMVIGTLLALVGLGEPIDLLAHNMRAVVNQRPASDNIVIVKIDDKSLRTVGNWPWSRAVQARLVDRLSALGARQIVYDVMFAFPSDAAGDAAFSDALKRSGRVTLGVNAFGQSSTDRLVLPAFGKNAKVGDVALHYSWDSRVHEIAYSREVGPIRVPGLATSLAGWKIYPFGNYPLDYSVDPSSFQSVSAADVISGTVDPTLLAGRVALIGTTTDTLGDQFVLPRYGRMGGVYIHALGAETLMRGRPMALGWLPGLFIAGFTAALAMIRRRALSQNLILATGAALLIAGPTPFEANLLFFEIGPGLYVLTIIAWHLNWSRMRHRSTLNEVSGLPNLVALRADPEARDRPLVVARLHNYAEIVSAVPPESERHFVEQVTSRLCVGATGRKLFHGDEGLFCWFAEPDIPLGHHLEALHALFRSPVKVRGQHYDVMLSFGVDIGSGRAAANRLGSALVAADEAEAEGLKWKYHDPARLADASWKLSLLSQLDDAIEKGEVWVAYQPKLELASGTIIGVEALARWTHPEKGPISPTEFIGAAEQHDRIEGLTDFILDEAVAAVSLAARQGRSLSLAVNLSARLLNDANLPRRVSDCLARHGLPPAQLTLELTETAALAGTGKDIEMLNRLRELGVKISIDDYGTGLSTLDYLKKVPAAEIKIDQSFIKSLRDNRSDRVMVQSTIALAHSLGRIVVAEGVEDRETLELLTTMGCDVAQGFIIGRATSLRSIIKRMKVERGLRVA
ncbi:MAG: EAL domain-containing protein [Sphingomicrobium sp.]